MFYFFSFPDKFQFRIFNWIFLLNSQHIQKYIDKLANYKILAIKVT